LASTARGCQEDRNYEYGCNRRFRPRHRALHVHPPGHWVSPVQSIDAGRHDEVWRRLDFRATQPPAPRWHLDTRRQRLTGDVATSERYDRPSEGDVDAVTTATNAAASADDALVRRARSGDAAAFGVLVDTRMDRCYRLAWSILSNDADAADATQDALVSAWRQLPRLRD